MSGAKWRKGWRTPTFQSTSRFGGITKRRRKKIAFVASSTDEDRVDMPVSIGPSSSDSRGIPLDPPQPHNSGPSVYMLLKDEEQKAWSSMRPVLIESALRSYIPLSHTCQLCSADLSSEPAVRCSDCGPSYLACMQCATTDHVLRPMHFTEKFQGNHFVYWMCNNELTSTKHSSDCEGFRQVMSKLSIVDYKGRQQDIIVTYCCCEPLSAHLVTLNYWPNNAKHPTTAFDMSFLQLANSLLLESHVSLKSFVDAVWHRNELSVKEANSLYRLLVRESFYEFRFLMRQLEELKTSMPANVCPACPENNPVVSLDANFGLVHKRSAGKSSAPPKSSLMFLPDHEVKAVVQSVADDSVSKQDQVRRMWDSSWIAPHGHRRWLGGSLDQRPVSIRKWNAVHFKQGAKSEPKLNQPSWIVLECLELHANMKCP